MITTVVVIASDLFKEVVYDTAYWWWLIGVDVFFTGWLLMVNNGRGVQHFAWKSLHFKPDWSLRIRPSPWLIKSQSGSQPARGDRSIDWLGGSIAQTNCGGLSFNENCYCPRMFSQISRDNDFKCCHWTVFWPKMLVIANILPCCFRGFVSIDIGRLLSLGR